MAGGAIASWKGSQESRIFGMSGYWGIQENIMSGDSQGYKVTTSVDLRDQESGGL